jgi:hypothetical protein
MKAVSRLQLLGDRVFDAGNRLLGDDGGKQPGGIVAGELLPPEVPNFADERLQAGVDLTGPSASDPYRKAVPTLAPKKWVATHQDTIAEAVRVLGDSAHWVSAGPNETDVPGIGTAAVALEQSTDRLGASLPSPASAREGAHDLRLALLVAAESLRTLATPTKDQAALDESRRLRLIGERLWSAGSGLLVSGKTGRPSLYALPPSGVDPNLLHASG